MILSLTKTALRLAALLLIFEIPAFATPIVQVNSVSFGTTYSGASIPSSGGTMLFDLFSPAAGQLTNATITFAITGTASAADINPPYLFPPYWMTPEIQMHFWFVVGADGFGTSEYYTMTAPPVYMDYGTVGSIRGSFSLLYTYSLPLAGLTGTGTTPVIASVTGFSTSSYAGGNNSGTITATLTYNAVPDATNTGALFVCAVVGLFGIRKRYAVNRYKA